MEKTTDSITIFLLTTIVVLLLMTGFILTIIYLYRRRQIAFEAELEKIRLDYDNNLLSTQLEIQEQLFQNVSREIHDNISLSLTLAKLQLHTIDFSKPLQIQESVESVAGHISKAILDLSDISRNLDTDIIKQKGLISAVETEINKLQKANLYQIEFQQSGSPVFMDGEEELIIFRIFQESVNNIIKHAKAKKITITMDYTNTHLHLTIKDDGIGYEKDKIKNSNRAGLNNIQKRAAIINGTVNIHSEGGAGTIIQLIIPIK